MLQTVRRICVMLSQGYGERPRTRPTIGGRRCTLSATVREVNEIKYVIARQLLPSLLKANHMPITIVPGQLKPHLRPSTQ
jgi:hypothetical protein